MRLTSVEGLVRVPEAVSVPLGQELRNKVARRSEKKILTVNVTKVEYTVVIKINNPNFTL